MTTPRAETFSRLTAGDDPLLAGDDELWVGDPRPSPDRFVGRRGARLREGTPPTGG